MNNLGGVVQTLPNWPVIKHSRGDFRPPLNALNYYPYLYSLGIVTKKLDLNYFQKPLKRLGILKTKDQVILEPIFTS